MTDDAAPPPYTLIRDLPPTSRPRERLRDFGPTALSEAELLAILLRVGSTRESALSQAERLLARFGSLRGFAQASFAEMCNEKGLGEAKTAQIKAAIELGVRVARSTTDERIIVHGADDIANMLAPEMSLLDQEQVRIVLLDTRSRVIESRIAYVGSVHTTPVRIAELLGHAIRARATSFVLVHNHPSGDPRPSAADIQMTAQVREAAKLMDIELHDHVVIGGGRYASMCALGLGGFPRT